MKLPTNFRTTTIALVWLAASGATLSVCAQPNPDDNSKSSPRRQFNRPDGSGGFPGGAARFAPGLDRVLGVLTEEQKTSFREAIQSQREKVREIEEKLRDARKELLKAGLKEKFDEEAVRQKAMAAAKLEAEMMVIRAKAFSQMRPPLSTEQIEKLRTMPSPGIERQSERPRRRPEVPRDENGLPPKDKVPAEPKPN